MKLCIPVASDKAKDSELYGHFGSAPVFLLWDSDSDQTETVSNQNTDHEHGACSPLKAIGNTKIDAVVVAGIGARAIEALASMGIQVFQTSSSTVSDVIECYQNNSLKPMLPTNACSGHGGGCSH